MDFSKETIVAKFRLISMSCFFFFFYIMQKEIRMLKVVPGLTLNSTNITSIRMDLLSNVCWNKVKIARKCPTDFSNIDGWSIFPSNMIQVTATLTKLSQKHGSCQSVFSVLLILKCCFSELELPIACYKWIRFNISDAEHLCLGNCESHLPQSSFKSRFSRF